MMVRVTASENTKSESNMKISAAMLRVVSNNSTASGREGMEIAVKHAITEGENPVSIRLGKRQKADGV